MHRKWWKIGLCLLVLAAMALNVAGCGKASYQVDYCGAEFLYRNAKESYRAGTEVELIFDCIATDTDYSFYLDGEPVDWTYEEGCFVIRFVMPEHDMVLDFTSENTMLPME